MKMSEPWNAPEPPSPEEGMRVSDDPRVVKSHAPGQLPCPDNPPPPVGWRYLKGNAVPQGGREFAVAIVQNPTLYPMGAFVQKYLGQSLYAARVEWHSYIGKTGQTGVCVRGVNLMVPIDVAARNQPDLATPVAAESKSQVAPPDALMTGALTQEQVVQAIRAGLGRYCWVPVDGRHGVEVMARPLSVQGHYVAVSARTAQRCADLLSDADWQVQLSTVEVEDWVWSHAAKRPEPCLISPDKMNISCPAAIDLASEYLAKSLDGDSPQTLVAYGKNWVNDEALASHPGRAANYGMPSLSGRYPSQDGKYSLWQPLGFAHDLDHFDYSQLLRLLRVKRVAVEPLVSSVAVTEVSRPRRRLRVLHLGLVGDDIAAWQDFLHGQGFVQVAASGAFDEVTHNATVAFQRSHELKPDGWVGSQTFGCALQLGFDGVEQFGPDHREPLGIGSGEEGPNWPSSPVNLSVLSPAERDALFGAITCVPLGSDGSIRITNGFAAQNIVTTLVNELVGVQVGSVKSQGRVTLHKKAVRPFAALLAAWKQAGLLPLVLTFEGAYNPRFVRGRPGVLSAHAWGTAFDINYAWNLLGTTPALKGRKGSVRELVHLANEHGWYWGGHFRGRPDGMHFELSAL